MLQISVPVDVQRGLRLALQRAGSRECGGVLLGEHVGHNHFAVRQVTLQKPGAVASFMRSLVGVANAVRSFVSARGNDYTRFNYLGEWHSHPLFSVQPSTTDHSTMRDLAMEKAVGANFVVLLIFRLSGKALEGSAHTYLPDGSVHLSILTLEEES